MRAARFSSATTRKSKKGDSPARRDIALGGTQVERQRHADQYRDRLDQDDDGDGGADGADDEEDELFEAEDQLDKARAQREDALRAMRADVEALGLQVSKLDARLAVSSSGGSRSTVFRRCARALGEILELEVVITNEAAQSLALLNKHKTNDFRTSMLMKWSRSKTGRRATASVAKARTPSAAAAARPMRPRSRMSSSSCSGDKGATLNPELRDCDDQLEQIRLEEERNPGRRWTTIRISLKRWRSCGRAAQREQEGEAVAATAGGECTERALANELGVALDESGGTGGRLS